MNIQMERSFYIYLKLRDLKRIMELYRFIPLTVIAPDGFYFVINGTKLQNYTMIDQAFNASGNYGLSLLIIL